MKLRSLRPRYFYRRVGQLRMERRHPGLPWLTKSAILLLDSWLKPTDVGLEWGSGRSTLWFAERVGRLTSVEDNEKWYSITKSNLAEKGVEGKVDYRFIECHHREVDEPDSHPYADVALPMEDGSLDFALVDGNIRLLCMKVVLPKIKPGGLLILDNANRFVPNRFLDGNSTIHEPRDAPRSPEWGRVLAGLESWRWINTTDGIWDTRFWVKPC